MYVESHDSFQVGMCFTIITIAIALPEDDRLKNDLRAAQERHKETQAKLKSESQVADKWGMAVRTDPRLQDVVRKQDVRDHYLGKKFFYGTKTRLHLAPS